MPEQKPPCSSHELDFTTLTPASPRKDIDRARAVCASCPMLLSCLKYLETVEVSGLAGGMLEAQRAVWRHQGGLAADDTTWVDAFDVSDLTNELLRDIPAGPVGRLNPKVIELVERMTNAGYPAVEIVEVTGLTQSTVNYIRRERISGGLTEVRRAARRRDHDVLPHSEMVPWLEEHGYEAVLSETGRLPQRLVSIYNEAHKVREAAPARDQRSACA